MNRQRKKKPKKESFRDTHYVLSNGEWKVFRYYYSKKATQDYVLTDGEYAVCKMLDRVIELLEKHD